MDIQAFQLQRHFKDGLKGIYLVSGDEPLQLLESIDQIRHQAMRKGHTERTVVHVDASTDWNSVFAECANGSLFGDKSLLELRFGQAKVAKGAADALRDYLQQPEQDLVVIVQTAKLDRRAFSAAWVKAIQQVGVVIRVWPLQGKRLLEWVGQRMQQCGVQADEVTARMIASHSDGNIMAAAQEIEKLALLQIEQDDSASSQPVLQRQQSIYTTYDLVDALLQRQLNHSLSILQQLRADAVAATLVMWAFSELIRALLVSGPYSGTKTQNAFLYTKRDSIAGWNASNRQVNLSRLLVRCAQIDRMLKGRATGNEWEEMSRLCVRLCA